VDNRSEPDSWEVLEYFLLGVVVEIVHDGTPQSNPPPSYTESGTELPDLSTAAVELVIGVAIGFMLGFATKRHFPRWARMPLFSDFPASPEQESKGGPDPDRNRLTFGSPFLALYLRMPELAEMYRERERY
jgi:hypothetical protein